MRKITLRSFAFAFACILLSGSASAQQVDSNGGINFQQYQIRKEAANSGTVGVITYFAGTYARFGADLANVLNDHNGVRVLSIMGHGSKQNIEDLLYLKGVDVGLVMGDVLQYIAGNNKEVDLQKTLVYITRLYPEEIHLLVRGDIKSIYDLEGKKVSFGPSNSGTRITSVTTFDRLKINVQEVNFDEDEGLKALENGDVSAMIFSDGKPSQVISSIEPKTGIKLLNIPYEAPLQSIYVPSLFTHDDYPNLLSENESVETTAVPTVMIAYNWKRDSLRYNKLKNFTEAFFENFKKFLEPQRHPKWKEVSLLAKMPGWERFKPAEDMIRKLEETSRISGEISNTNKVAANREEFKKMFSRFEKSTNLTSSEAKDTDALFKNFSHWLEQNKDQ